MKTSILQWCQLCRILKSDTNQEILLDNYPVMTKNSSIPLNLKMYGEKYLTIHKTSTLICIFSWDRINSNVLTAFPLFFKCYLTNENKYHGIENLINIQNAVQRWTTTVYKRIHMRLQKIKWKATHCSSWQCEKNSVRKKQVSESTLMYGANLKTKNVNTPPIVHKMSESG